MSDLPIIELRRIEANIVKPIFEELVTELGNERAEAILDRAIRNDAIAQAQSLASENPPRSLADFAKLLERWTASDALVLDVQAQSEEQLDFNVTRCQYSEMYREMGLESIGHLLSCNRDGAFCEGYDERLTLERTQTLMGGATHCDFRYRFLT
ncbi:MAG: hypothetical protein ACI8PT_000253 [Gammaproteobacteria bacterium]|jgi:hypothetical protein